MSIVIGLIGLGAFVAWASAALHGVLLLRHVAPPRSAWSLAFQGWRFYDRATFLESGWPIHRRFVISAASFFGCVVLLVIASAAAGALG